jgi:hypothetical protein
MTYTVVRDIILYARWEYIEPGKPTRPVFKHERVFEWYKDAPYSVQTVGTLSSVSEGEVRFDIKAVRDNLGNNMKYDEWFEIVKDKIMTTSSYEADYDLVDTSQQRFDITVTATSIDEGIVSNPADLSVNISPWNDNPFEPKDDTASVRKGEKVVLDVLLNDDRDLDLPKDKNIRKVIGLTLDNLIPIVQRYGKERPDVILHPSTIKTLAGASVWVEWDKIIYDASSLNEDIKTGYEDVFYYTALDTAEYVDHNGDSYETDIWVKSVKVVVKLTVPVEINQSLKISPQPLNLSKNGKAHEPQRIDDGMASYYKIPQGTKGTAIIFELKGADMPDGPLVKKDAVKIFDKVGNLVNKIDMKFDYDNGKSKKVAGVAVWDGKNSKSRVVGAGLYKVVVEVEADFGNGKQKYSASSNAGIKY